MAGSPSTVLPRDETRLLWTMKHILAILALFLSRRSTSPAGVMMSSVFGGGIAAYHTAEDQLSAVLVP
jgi:hypothetical protein